MPLGLSYYSVLHFLTSSVLILIMVILLQSVSCASNLQAGFTSADVGALNLQSFRVKVNCCTVFSVWVWQKRHTNRLSNWPIIIFSQRRPSLWPKTVLFSDCLIICIFTVKTTPQTRSRPVKSEWGEKHPGALLGCIKISHILFLFFQASISALNRRKGDAH